VTSDERDGEAVPAISDFPSPVSGVKSEMGAGDSNDSEPPAARSAARRPSRARGKKALREYAAVLLARLTAAYPDARCELDAETPLQLLVATILSAQCTDKRVNMVTPALFARFPDAEALAAAELAEVEALVKTTGFFRSKAKSVVGMARAVVAEHGGAVPAEMDALTQLPGVGRKTANVILGNAFGVNEGVVVDTHVGRLALRLGLTAETDPVKVEQALAPLFPRESWTLLAHLLIAHGRRICVARSPRCGECMLADLCPKVGVAGLGRVGAGPAGSRKSAVGNRK
jgi:endonuclease-3